MNAAIRLGLAALLAVARPREAAVAVRRLPRAAILLAVAAMMAAGAAICLVAALWYYCLPRLGPGCAALVVAAALMIASVVLLVAARGRSPRQSNTSPRSPALDELLPIAALSRLLDENKTALLLAVLAAGLLLGTRDGKRPPRT